MTKRVGTKIDRRAAVKEYRRQRAARAAAAKRRRQALLGAGTALAVVVVIVGAYLLLRDGGDADQAGTPAPTVTASGTQATGVPPLPEGADPALNTKPSVGPGTGELTDLNVTTLVEGTGPAVQAGQTITVNYVGVS
jgi:peptidylprolyl isomerase